ncbi:MAG: NAD(P)/FAD-dependent oxidoreductase [Parcubacteria group bacterium]|nr:NAD(P)/FAD-dependent oxidoreductase [Parcubacteria group bacterium]
MAKIVVIGAGHNGLVAACYLAKAGHNVEIFERLRVVGGCATTDETTFPGFKISSASYVNSLFLPRIVNDLELKKYGYEVLKRDPASFTPLESGEYLLLGNDIEENMRQIRKFSSKDEEAYPKYEKALIEIASIADFMLTMTPPYFPPRTMSDIKKYTQILKELVKRGVATNIRLCKLLTQDARKFLNSWFESEVLKATLLTDSTIGATDFSGYVLLHHVMGEAGGSRGVWGYQRGGMGAISNALAASARNLGVRIHTDCKVEKIILSPDESRAVGISLKDGRCIYADIVISNADPKNTFTKLVSIAGKNKKLKNFVHNVRLLDFGSPVMKVNLILSGLPHFRCMPDDASHKMRIGPEHRGSIHIAPSTDYIQRAHEDFKHGHPSEKPILEITIPSSIDNTLAPHGRHVMGIFVQYVPYHRADGKFWDDVTKKEYFEKNILGAMMPYISNMSEIIEGVEILSPIDLENRFGITEGNIFHGAMSLSQIFSLRPLRGYADYRTPIKNLFLCGAGTHPGGGVTGACGFNSAREIIVALQKKAKQSDSDPCLSIG